MTSACQPHVCLASASPRRRDLLLSIGVDVDIHPCNVDETPQINESPSDYVVRLAVEKALVADALTPLPTLGSDTAVVLDGKILGKEEHLLSVDFSAAAHNTVAEKTFFIHAKARRAPGDVTLVLDKRLVIKQQREPFTGCELSSLMLGVDSLLSAPRHHLGAELFKLFKRFFVSHSICLRSNN